MYFVAKTWYDEAEGNQGKNCQQCIAMQSSIDFWKNPKKGKGKKNWIQKSFAYLKIVKKYIFGRYKLLVEL